MSFLFLLSTLLGQPVGKEVPLQNFQINIWSLGYKV